MVAPVAGLRAVRAGRSLFSKTPNPVMATLSPLATADWIASSTAFTASVADFLSPSRPEIASIKSRLFMFTPALPPQVAWAPIVGITTSDLPESRRSSAVAQQPWPHWPACRPISQARASDRYTQCMQMAAIRCSAPLALGLAGWGGGGGGGGGGEPGGARARGGGGGV